MIYSTMQYKDYVWAHNPKSINILSSRDIKEALIPYCGNEFQDYGMEKRIVKGIGEFYGENCLEQYKVLVDLFNKKGTGYLSLPNVPPFLAIFKSLRLEGSAKPNILSYSFEFWECLKKETENKSLLTNFHVVTQGQNLWDISFLYDIKVEDLLAINKNIKNPNNLILGEKVYLE